MTKAKTLTDKQDKFCRLYIELGHMSDAYRGAYNTKSMKDTTVNNEASKLLARPHIAARVAEIKEKHAEEHNITVEWLTTKYLETFEMACNQGKASEAKGVLDSLGKLHGHMVEKKQVNGNIQHNHASEPISETFNWIAESLRDAKASKAEKSLLN